MKDYICELEHCHRVIVSCCCIIGLATLRYFSKICVGGMTKERRDFLFSQGPITVTVLY